MSHATDRPAPQAVRQSFEKSVATYDRAAALQREMANLLLARLTLWRKTPVRLLDLGCGTGALARELVQRMPQTTVVAADLAHGMARATRQRARRGWWSRRRAQAVTASAMQLPFASGAFDVVLSNLMLQWCEPQRVFAEVRRVLRPGGLWLFTTFGQDTLQELREAWRAADDGVHVHVFPDMHDLGDLLLAEGFVDPVVDVERVRHFLPSVHEVLMNLKALGAHNLAPQRSKALTGKGRYRRFVQAYEAMADAAGRVPVSYEVIFGHAIAPSLAISTSPVQFHRDVPRNAR